MAPPKLLASNHGQVSLFPGERLWIHPRLKHMEQNPLKPIYYLIPTHLDLEPAQFCELVRIRDYDDKDYSQSGTPGAFLIKNICNCEIIFTWKAFAFDIKPEPTLLQNNVTDEFKKFSKKEAQHLRRKKREEDRPQLPDWHDFEPEKPKRGGWSVMD